MEAIKVKLSDKQIQECKREIGDAFRGFTLIGDRVKSYVIDVATDDYDNCNCILPEGFSQKMLGAFYCFRGFRRVYDGRK